MFWASELNRVSSNRLSWIARIWSSCGQDDGEGFVLVTYAPHGPIDCLGLRHVDSVSMCSLTQVLGLLGSFLVLVLRLGLRLSLLLWLTSDL